MSSLRRVLHAADAVGTTLAFINHMTNARPRDQIIFEIIFRRQRSRICHSQKAILNFALAMVLLFFIHSAVGSSASEANSAAQPSQARLEAARDEVANARSNVFLPLVGQGQRGT